MYGMAALHSCGNAEPVHSLQMVLSVSAFRGHVRARARCRAVLIADEIVSIADTEPDAKQGARSYRCAQMVGGEGQPEEVRRQDDKIQTASANTTYVVSDQPMSPDEWEAKHCVAASGGLVDSTR